MPFIKVPRRLADSETKWDTLIYTQKNASLAKAQRVASSNPKIKFFSYCLEKTVFENPHQEFEPGDALFFSSHPCFGSDLKFETYQKTGISVAYVGETQTMVKDMADASAYVTSQGTPAVDIVCIFAANINTAPVGSAIPLAPGISIPNGALACGNPDIVAVLKSGVVKALQEAGITVLLTYFK